MLARFLSRCASAEAIITADITWLLAVLIGAKSADRLAVAVVDLLEEGIAETWYEKKIRKAHRGMAE